MRTACLVALAWAATATTLVDPAGVPAAPTVAASEFNCRTREVWTAEKSAWCCKEMNVGCKKVDEKEPLAPKRPVDEKKPVDEKEPLAPKRPVDEKKPVDEKEPLAPKRPVDEKKPVDEKDMKFNCRTREVWTAEKSAWCCKAMNVGCKKVDEKEPLAPKRPVDEKEPLAPKRPVDEKKPVDEKDMKFNCRTREVWTAEKSAWCCSEMFVGCDKKFVEELQKRDIQKKAAESRAGKKHRGLRMHVTGDKDEAKLNPRALLKKVRKTLRDASVFLRKNPSALVVKAFKVGDADEEVPIFREWNEKLAAEELLEQTDSRQALALQATAAGSDIAVSYEIVAPQTDVDAAVTQVADSIGAAAVTPREESESHGKEDHDHDHEHGHDGDEGTMKTVLYSIASLVGGAALCGLVALTVQRRRNKQAEEAQFALAAEMDALPLADVEALDSQVACRM